MSRSVRIHPSVVVQLNDLASTLLLQENTRRLVRRDERALSLDEYCPRAGIIRA